MPDIVARLLELIANPKTSAREVLGAITLVAAYTDGKPVGRQLNYSVHDRLLPPGFAGLPAQDKRHVIDDLRRRALAGELPALTDGDGDE